MAYDLELAERIREVLAAAPGVSEKRMFGGLAFLVNGNLAVSASGQGGMLLRVDPAESAALVDGAGVQLAVMGGRTMAGWLRIAPELVEDDAELGRWVARGVAYASSLPPK